MKQLKQNYLMLVVALFAGCDNENAFDCVKTVGDIYTQEINLPEFNKVEVIGDIELVIENNESQIVTLTTGENLFSKIDFEVVDGKLIVTDNNKCSWVRKYGNTKLYVGKNGITEIHNTGSRNIKSTGTYLFDGNLNLVSKNTSGDYHLDVDGGQLSISSNKVSNFYISGQLEALNVGFYSGQGRFEGENLKVNSATFFHRGSNDMIVNVTQSISGKIESYGNVVVYGAPSVVDIEYNGTGQVIFK